MLGDCLVVDLPVHLRRVGEDLLRDGDANLLLTLVDVRELARNSVLRLAKGSLLDD